MSSKIFNTLLEERIELFIGSFRNTSRAVFFDEKKEALIHSGEFGTYRERVVMDFLRFFIPQRLEMGSGFVITSNDEVSSQCDIIVYDRSITPLIQSSQLQTFYPVETVVGVGEIKSVMTKSDLRDAVLKLAKTKQLKSLAPFPNNQSRKGAGFDPSGCLYDNIFSFIVCEKFDFNTDNLVEEIEDMYGAGIEYFNRHNMILSIEDGLLMYNWAVGDNNMIFYSPIAAEKNAGRFLKANISPKFHHFKVFAISFFDGISNATVLYPEISRYLEGLTVVNRIGK